MTGLTQKIVCVVMILHDPTWLCPRLTRLYINYLGKVYEENEWREHFRKLSCDITAQLYIICSRVQTGSHQFWNRDQTKKEEVASGICSKQSNS